MVVIFQLMVVIFWKIELTTDGPRQFLQWMPPDLFLVAGVQKSIETLDPTIPLQHQTFSTQSKSRCETKSLNHKVNNFWCFVCMWVMHIACVQCVRTMCIHVHKKNPDHLYSLINHWRTTDNISYHIFSESW